MAHITNHMPTAELQALDAAHHMHPFTTNDELAEKGARIITRAKGVYLTDSEGTRSLTGWRVFGASTSVMAVRKWPTSPRARCSS